MIAYMTLYTCVYMVCIVLNGGSTAAYVAVPGTLFHCVPISVVVC